MRSPRLPLPGALALAVLLGAVGASADVPKREWNPFPIGKELPDFEAKDLDGGTFRLTACRTISKDEALAAVYAAAKENGSSAPKAEDALASLPGIQGENGALDAEKRMAFLRQAGRSFGLIAGPETGATWKTLGEVGDWIVAAAEAPIVLIVWSSKCPTSKEYEERLMDVVSRTGARVFPLASSGVGETDEEAKGYVEAAGLPYRVLLDRDQKVCDLLGGLRTPHAFVIDRKNRLRYAGAIDDDPIQEKASEAERRNYLLEALEAVKAGKEVNVWMTAPKG